MDVYVLKCCIPSFIMPWTGDGLYEDQHMDGQCTDQNSTTQMGFENLSDDDANDGYDSEYESSENEMDPHDCTILQYMDIYINVDRLRKYHNYLLKKSSKHWIGKIFVQTDYIQGEFSEEDMENMLAGVCEDISKTQKRLSTCAPTPNNRPDLEKYVAKIFGEDKSGQPFRHAGNNLYRYILKEFPFSHIVALRVDNISQRMGAKNGNINESCNKLSEDERPQTSKNLSNLLRKMIEKNRWHRRLLWVFVKS